MTQLDAAWPVDRCAVISRVERENYREELWQPEPKKAGGCYSEENGGRGWLTSTRELPQLDTWKLPVCNYGV